MVSSKFAQSPPVRKTPAYCKKVIPPTKPYTFPPAHLVANVWWQGQTDDSRTLDVLQTVDLTQDPLDPQAFAAIFAIPGFSFEVDFFSVDLLTNFSCVLRVLEGAVQHAGAQAIDVPKLPSDPYDTREQTCSIFQGTGDAGFRILL